MSDIITPDDPRFFELDYSEFPRLPYKYWPRKAQIPIWTYFEKGGKRAIAVCHRRFGKDLLGINLIGVKGQQRVGLYFHMFPTYAQGRKVAWEGFRKDGQRFINSFPKELVKATNNNEMRVTFWNDSVYQVVGTDNIDRLVGTNPIGIVFSEYALADPRAWNYVRPILAENGGWALFIYTPRGKNHGWDLLSAARTLPRWFTTVIGNDLTGYIPLEEIEEDRLMGMPEELIQQEYYCSFDAGMVGSYWGDLMEKAEKEGRITDVPYDPTLPVYTAWDIGVNDQTVIWFFQRDGLMVNFIDYYVMDGKGVEHYAKVVHEKPYAYGPYHLGPHDLQQREWGNNAMPKIAAAAQHGIHFKCVKKVAFQEGIDAARRQIGHCRFDKHKCEHGIRAMKEYSKQWDDKKAMFLDKHDHNWASHPADAFKTFSLGFTIKSDIPRKYSSQSNDRNYDPLTYGLNEGIDY